MNDVETKNQSALRQQRYRERQKENGSQRFDIYIPADLWAELKPQLRKYGYPYHPGKAIVSLLADIDFGDD
ncbi:MAG: hypothetical protein ACXW1Z_22110 [Methylobacter sp.]